MVKPLFPRMFGSRQVNREGKGDKGITIGSGRDSGSYQVQRAGKANRQNTQSVNRAGKKDREVYPKKADPKPAKKTTQTYRKIGNWNTGGAVVKKKGPYTYRGIK